MVKTTSEITVSNATYSAENTLPLSPVDALFVGSGSYPIEFTFFYEKPFTIELFRARLNHAWREVAEHCPPLKSRLEIKGDRYVLAWRDFLSTAETITFKSVSFAVHPDRHPNPYELIDPVTTKPGEPLARLKITEGNDGTVLGFSLSHAVADGFTYFMILGAIARATNPITANDPITVMNHGRELLFDIARNAKSIAVLGLSQSDVRKDIDRHSIRYAKKHYSAERLRDLFQKFAGAPKKLSTNDMICAELWREFTLEFDGEECENLSLVAPVDCRRIYPDFPQNFVGNAVVLSRLDLSRDQVIGMPAGELAISIRQMVEQVNLDYVETSCAGLNSKLTNDEWAGLGDYHLVDPKSGLLITNLSRLPLASLDFGTGAPSYCRPLTPCSRTIVLLSDGSDGIVAHIHY